MPPLANNNTVDTLQGSEYLDLKSSKDSLARKMSSAEHQYDEENRCFESDHSETAQDLAIILMNNYSRFVDNEIF
jgi:hypothetical protein